VRETRKLSSLRPRSLWASASLILAALGLLAAPAVAATVTVNTTVDQATGSCASSCSLRDAVTTANEGDTVQIPAGHYVLTLGDIIFAKGLMIVGAGARSTVLDGNGASRIFQFTDPASPPGPVEIDDVALVNGMALTPDPAQGLDIGGAIAGLGTLTLRRCLVANNQAAGGGGGIFWRGTLTVDQCTIAGNRATGSGGTSSFAGGGGIFAFLGPATITNSTLTGNTTAAGGLGGGGALLFFTIPVSLVNDTIEGNQAPQGEGGGLLVAAPGTLANTIVAGNQGGDCFNAGTPLTTDHSLDSDNSCGLVDAGSKPGVNPLLGPLANNGGPTDTQALLAGSPAIDAGDNATCQPTDQRGVTRPQGPACDIGAYELVEAPDCSHATASPNLLWPPNHKFVPIQITGVTNPGGGPVTITVTSIFQDEPVHSPGSGNTGPDGTGVGSSTASVRAERDGGGDGRVYHISFTATNASGGSCTGAVTVGVPHDQGPHGGPVDEGPLYDSTQP
jgi:CSLREA domain-containing protein